MPHPFVTFSKGVQKCVKKYVQVQLGIGPREVPLPGRSEQAARDSQEKGEHSNCPRSQGSCQRLFHYRPGPCYRPACNGDCSVEVWRCFSQRAGLSTGSQEGQGRQEKIGTLQRYLQTALQRIHPLEGEYRRGCRSGRSAVLVQQHRDSHEHARDREGFQEDSGQSGLALSLLHSLSQTYICLRALQGQRVQPAAGPEAAWTCPHRNHPGLCRHNGARHAKGPSEALCLSECEYRSDGSRKPSVPADRVCTDKKRLFF